MARIAMIFAAISFFLTSQGFGQCQNGYCPAPAYQPVYQTYQTVYQPVYQQYQPVYQAYQPTYAVASQSAGDPYGFIGWLNGVRAQYGLCSVSYDPNLAGWAAMNNQHQSSRGLGHHVMGPARRQNSAMAGTDAASVGVMWMASPGHRAALLDPTITSVGIAAAGNWWTFNAN